MVLKDKKTRVIFHNGVMSIGGTLIEVIYEDARIFFDFGTLFKPELDLADEKLETLIKHELAPSLEGVYDSRLLGENERITSYAHEAIFISHSHLDHTRMLNYSSEDIPVYALKETAYLLKVLNQSNDFLLPRYDHSDGSYTRSLISVKPNESIKVGEIEVTMMRVDHDTSGAAGLKIITPDLHLAYSGDYRLHGRHPEWTLDFAKANQNADVFITEGVSVSFEAREELEDSKPNGSYSSEIDLEEALVELIQNNPNRQITFDAYEAHPERFLTFINNGIRECVISSYQAQIMKQCLALDVKYYDDGKTSIEGLDPSLKVELKELIEDKENYIWQFNHNMDNLKGGGVYIHSNAAPLGPFDPSYEPFVEAFGEKKIEFVKMACSGHAHPEDLERVVDLAQAKVLIPIHTLRPEVFVNPHGEVYLVNNKEEI